MSGRVTSYFILKKRERIMMRNYKVGNIVSATPNVTGDPPTRSKQLRDLRTASKSKKSVRSKRRKKLLKKIAKGLGIGAAAVVGAAAVGAAGGYASEYMFGGEPEVGTGGWRGDMVDQTPEGWELHDVTGYPGLQVLRPIEEAPNPTKSMILGALGFSELDPKWDVVFPEESEEQQPVGTTGELSLAQQQVLDMESVPLTFPLSSLLDPSEMVEEPLEKPVTKQEETPVPTVSESVGEKTSDLTDVQTSPVKSEVVKSTSALNDWLDEYSEISNVASTPTKNESLEKAGEKEEWFDSFLRSAKRDNSSLSERLSSNYKDTVAKQLFGMSYADLGGEETSEIASYSGFSKTPSERTASILESTFQDEGEEGESGYGEDITFQEEEEGEKGEEEWANAGEAIPEVRQYSVEIAMNPEDTSRLSLKYPTDLDDEYELDMTSLFLREGAASYLDNLRESLPLPDSSYLVPSAKSLNEAGFTKETSINIQAKFPRMAREYDKFFLPETSDYQRDAIQRYIASKYESMQEIMDYEIQEDEIGEKKLAKIAIYNELLEPFKARIIPMKVYTDSFVEWQHKFKG